MGVINTNVENTYFRIYPENRDTINAFLANFDVNHGSMVTTLNTSIHCFLMKPSDRIANTFGLSDELLVVYSIYDKLQARTIEAIENVFGQHPFRARANPLSFFLISNDAKGEQWVQRYLIDHPQFRTPVVFNEQELIRNKNDRSYVTNVLHSQLFVRDLFDYQLPLDEDLYFFGRSLVVDSLVDGVRKSQNKGLFGLRKTGKTSLLFKLRRICSESKIATCVYVDCKLPDIRSKRWDQLINHLCVEILKARKKDIQSFANMPPTDRLREILESLREDERICVIFDEIEFISPVAKLDEHWKMDFTNFWQTIWSIQSQIRKLSVVIAGVNPFVTEVDLFNGVQNPMFGIVHGTMLTGLDEPSSDAMIARIGRQMGLVFEAAALNYLHRRCGGHPLLTRMACSFTNSDLFQGGSPRPIRVTEKYLLEKETERDGELQFYCRHIVSELRDFYPEEYQLLEMLARGNIVDFVELAAEPEWVRHLKGYGILSIDSKSKPSFRIPVLQRYVANEAARIAKTAEPRQTVPTQDRVRWLERRKASVISEFKSFLKIVSDKGLKSPYGSNFLPEANRISDLRVVNDWNDYGSFINSIHLCLVETIDQSNGSKYFFGEMKDTFPALFLELRRIRVFRNNVDHLRLNKAAENVFDEYVEIDLQSKTITSYKEPWFLLQQIVMDELFVGIQIEINNLS